MNCQMRMICVLKMLNFKLKMAKVSKVRRKSVSRRYRGVPYSKPSSKKIKHGVCEKKCYHASEKIDWTDSTCSVCMESPHNAVLLLCSSYNKGCRPYMCATSYRYSNCLDQFKKAYTKVISSESTRPGLEFDLDLSLPDGKTELTKLLCPLCRGQVGRCSKGSSMARSNHYCYLQTIVRTHLRGVKSLTAAIIQGSNS